MKNDVYEFVEPHESGGICIIRVTEQQAIEWTKQIHPNFYEKDEDALEDFIAVHWAKRLMLPYRG